MARGRWRRRLVALAILAGFGYLLLLRYDAPRGETGAWLRRAGLTPRWAEINGQRVRYVRDGSGPPLVLIHGFASSIYTWSEVWAGLRQGHEVVALDLPGFGASDMPADLRWPALPGSVLGLMDRLGLARASVVGHSLGGAVAVVLASSQPERVDRLVLVDSAGFNLDPSARPKVVSLVASPRLGALAGRLPLHRVLLNLALRQVFHDPGRATPERVEEYLEPVSRPEWLPAMRSLMLSRGDELAAFPSLLARIHAATLILWGRADVWAPVDHARRFHEGIPGARVVIFDNCGHVPQEELPAVTLAELQPFLAP